MSGARRARIGKVMPNEPIADPDLEDCMTAAVDRGEFATLEEARADFWAKLDESIAQADRGELHDLDEVFDELRERYANWPRAAE